MGSVFRLQSESERITFMPLTDIVKIDDGNNPPLYMKIPRYNAAKLIRNALGFNDVQRLGSCIDFFFRFCSINSNRNINATATQNYRYVITRETNASGVTQWVSRINA